MYLKSQVQPSNIFISQQEQEQTSPSQSAIHLTNQKNMPSRMWSNIIKNLSLLLLIWMINFCYLNITKDDTTWRSTVLKDMRKEYYNIL